MVNKLNRSGSTDGSFDNKTDAGKMIRERSASLSIPGSLFEFPRKLHKMTTSNFGFLDNSALELIRTLSAFSLNQLFQMIFILFVKITRGRFIGEVEYFEVTAEELGYPTGCSLGDIQSEGVKHNFSLCSRYEALLALSYLTSFPSGKLIIAMEPIKDRYGYLYFPCVSKKVNYHYPEFLCYKVAAGDIEDSQTRWLVTRVHSSK